MLVALAVLFSTRGLGIYIRTMARGPGVVYGTARAQLIMRMMRGDRWDCLTAPTLRSARWCCAPMAMALVDRFSTGGLGNYIRAMVRAPGVAYAIDRA